MRYITRSRRRAISFVVVRQVGIERLFIARPPFTPPCSFVSSPPRVIRARIGKPASLPSLFSCNPDSAAGSFSIAYLATFRLVVRFARIARRARRASEKRQRRVAESIPLTKGASDATQRHVSRSSLPPSRQLAYLWK